MFILLIEVRDVLLSRLFIYAVNCFAFYLCEKALFILVLLALNRFQELLRYFLPTICRRNEWKIQLGSVGERVDRRVTLARFPGYAHLPLHL